MVWKLDCDCNERVGVKVDSMKLFEELKEFFNEQAENEAFKEEEVIKPFYTWKDDGEEVEWYATKWYKCLKCGCLWEFEYPDFPTSGFLRKF